MGALCGELPAEDVAAATYVVLRWAKDSRNHRFERDQIGSDVLWPRCTRGKRIPQRTCFADELSPDLGDNRDRSEDCRTCFFAGPPAPQKLTW